MTRMEKDAKRLAGDKRHVQLCFVTDPYQPFDVAPAVTRSAIQILHGHSLNVSILTKGGNRALRDLDLLGQNDKFGVTLTFTKEKDSQTWEPNAALPLDRINSLRLAHACGIPTWVSLEPVIKPNQTLELIELTHEFVDEFYVGKLNYCSSINMDWGKFVSNAIAMFYLYEANYYIKNDLMPYMPAGVLQRERFHDVGGKPRWMK